MHLMNRSPLACALFLCAPLSGCLLPWDTLRPDGSTSQPDVIVGEDAMAPDSTTGPEASVEASVDVFASDAADTTTILDASDVADAGTPMDAPDVREASVDAQEAGVDVQDSGPDVRDAAAEAEAGPVCTPVLVVNEVQSRGTTASDEFIEIYNAGTCAVNLEGWSLVYLSSSGSGSPSSKWMGTAAQTLAPGQYGVVISGSVGTIPAGAITLATLTTVGIADSGGVALLRGATRVDSVSFGTSSAMVSATHMFTENTPATSATAGTIVVARSPNGRDTDNNSVDFTLRTMGTPGDANP